MEKEIKEYIEAMEEWARACGELANRLRIEQEEILRKLGKLQKHE